MAAPIRDVQVSTVTKAVTPTALYSQLISSMFDSFRCVNDGKAHYPAQFGGISGQRSVLAERSVLDITNIEG